MLLSGLGQHSPEDSANERAGLRMGAAWEMGWQDKFDLVAVESAVPPRRDRTRTLLGLGPL